MLGPEMRFTDPAAHIAEELTCIPPDFIQQVVHMRADLIDTPLSNDNSLGAAYEQAMSHSPESRPRTHGVIIIVGNGSFESATQLFPREFPIIFIDNNARTLLRQKLIMETLRSSGTLVEYKSNIRAVEQAMVEALQTMGSEPIVEKISPVRHDLQSKTWGEATTPFYLSSEEAFQRAKEGVQTRHFGFYLCDIHDRDQVTTLSDQLIKAEARIVLANLTNAFSLNYTSLDKAEWFKEKMPFSALSQVITSKVHDDDPFLTAKATSIYSWQRMVPFSEK